jgi:hypothetical protein
MISEIVELCKVNISINETGIYAFSQKKNIMPNISSVRSVPGLPGIAVM